MLKDAALVVRSKNAGPFELTFDVIFKEQAYFERAVQEELITAETFAALYGIDPSQVLGVIAFEPALAIKITIRRTIPSGGFGERDVYGAQQHVPLCEMPFPSKSAE